MDGSLAHFLDKACGGDIMDDGLNPLGFVSSSYFLFNFFSIATIGSMSMVSVFPTCG